MLKYLLFDPWGSSNNNYSINENGIFSLPLFMPQPLQGTSIKILIEMSNYKNITTINSYISESPGKQKQILVSALLMIDVGRGP